jgi:acyl-coenzyme A thioesterase 13
VHGGLIMSLTDTLGSLAVASQGQYMTGVSTDISTSFVKPAGKPGEEVKIRATLTAMGTFRRSTLFLVPSLLVAV